MTICDYCGEDFNIVYTCNYCHGRFCVKHKKPHQHDCKSIKQSEKNILFSSSENEDKINSNMFNSSRKEIVYSPIKDSSSKSILSSLFNPASTDFIESPDHETNETSLVSLKDKHSNKESKPTYSIPDKTKNRGGFFSLKLILIFLMICSFALNGFLYTEYQDYQGLSVDYMHLYNNTIELNSYYETLTNQYAELRQEYTRINNIYTDLSSNHDQLETEYQAMMNYQISKTLEENMTITLGPQENYSIIYKIPFSGIIDVNYTATGEAYTWIGSTKLNGYYSRVPQFPETASEIEFTLPVYPDLVIYFANPSELESITLTYCLNFTY